NAEITALESTLEQVPPNQSDMMLSLSIRILEKMISANENMIDVIELFSPSMVDTLRQELEWRKKQYEKLLRNRDTDDEPLTVPHQHARFIIDRMNYERKCLDAIFVAVVESAGRIADPIKIFNSMNFHKVIHEVSFPLFVGEHYDQAIFDAYKALNNYVKDKSGRADLDGKDLMVQVFSSKNPILQLNPLQNESDEDEQEGFMFLYMGSMVGIRNPKAHETIQQPDPIKTLEWP